MFNKKKLGKAGQAVLEYTLIFVVVILSLAATMDKIQTSIANKAYTTMRSVCLSDNADNRNGQCP
jgi:uncharacterized protein (UPF0333 family)